jgi:spore germination protein
MRRLPTQATADRNEAQDFRAIGALVDEVRVMTYDYHWDTSPPGPDRAGRLGARRNRLGRHPDPVGERSFSVRCRSATTGSAGKGPRSTICGRWPWHVLITRASRGPCDGSPSFTYTDHDRTHGVWFEDAASVRAKLDLARRYRLGGVFFSRLGGEDPAVWATG